MLIYKNNAVVFRFFPRLSKSTLSIAIAACSGLFGSAFTHAAGMDLTEYGAASFGSAHAAGATYRSDASGLRFNPASLAAVTKPSWVIDGAAIQLHEHFSDGTVTAYLQDNATGEVGTTDTFSGQNIPLGQPTLLAGKNQQVKSRAGLAGDFYVATPIGSKGLVAGIGFYVPYVFQNKFDDDWVGRFSGTNMDLVSVEMHPALAYKLTPSFSFGFGIPILYVRAKETKFIDFSNESIISAAITHSAIPSLEGNAAIDLKGYGAGLSGGFQWQIDSTNFLGFSFITPITAKLDGKFTYNLPELYKNIADALHLDIFPSSPDSTSSFNFPGRASLSYEHGFGSGWKWMSDLSFTQWSRLEEFRAKVPAFVDQVQVQNLQNTWRFATGVEYALTHTTTLRAGLAYDRSAAQSAEYRTPLGPEADRRIFAAGVGYKLNGDKRIDLAFSYESWLDSKVNYTDTMSFPANYPFYNAAQKYHVNGNWNASVFACALQFSDSF